ncbi:MULTISPECIES: hypothetical protein [unclassified Thioalkalivibrio]|uniref:hypothetical protein n=1 Tax=unclassified Thioalkalivibrio TaxID=2621013 RepID=UPI000367D546|nr:MULTISPECIES: hypothetical protein [unclassified Thioalkalivibrio]
MSRQRILALPEFNVAVFAFLLNYPWEFLQVPFFDDMPTMPHWEAVVFCTRATLGDVLIALAAFWGVAALARNRSWILQPTLRTVLLFVAIGVVITIGLEWHATEIDDRWQYADTMPTLPILGTGLLPLVQWVILPLLLIWFVRRQVRGQLVLNNE